MTRPSARARVVAGVAAASCLLAGGLLAGCTADPDSTRDPSPTPSASASASTIPDGGAPLVSWNISHGPDGFSLPRGLRPSRIIDQPNVVTITFEPGQAGEVESYLQTNTKTLGLGGVASRPGSMVFTVKGWEGGLASNDKIAGLTLRRQG